MIKDYTKYELTGREKRIFYFAGYGTVFLVVYLFYHSILLSAVSGCLVYFLQPLVERQLAERRMNLLTVQFKDLLYSLSASVAAGRQMGEALVEAEQIAKADSMPKYRRERIVCPCYKLSRLKL